jgi:hypothetical protein
MDGTTWNGLSPSSQNALRFAWAIAQERTGAPPTAAEVSSYDLLLGIMMSHPGRTPSFPEPSEPEQFFDFYEIGVRQLLPPGYEDLSADRLRGRLPQTPDGPPENMPEIEDVISETVMAGGHLPNMWGKLLTQENRARTDVLGLLDRKGVSHEICEETDIWAQKATGRYSEVLERYRPGSISVVNYKADQTEFGAQTDYADISAQVDAFAYLIASRGLSPPLAVGLFGAWGSGKTFFMDALWQRIQGIMTTVSGRDQREIPVWKRIAQVRFNAWQYVEGDLWSSLAEHVFAELDRLSSGATDNAYEKRHDFLLKRLEKGDSEVWELSIRHRAIQREIEDKQEELNLARTQRDIALQELEETRGERVADKVIEASGATVADALSSLQIGTSAGAMTLGEAKEVLVSARMEAVQARNLLQPLLGNRQAMGLVILLAVGVPVLIGLLDHLWGSALAATGAVSSYITIALGVVGWLAREARSRLESIKNAQTAVDAELRKERDHREKRVNKAKAKVTEATTRLEALNERARDLRAELVEIRADLAKTPSQVLNEFLHDRVAAGDYRSRLGVPALIRRDFKALHEFIQAQNQWLLAPDETRSRLKAEDSDKVLPEQAEDPQVINRIVLYIDDLDRCPDDKVIEVLQAVHLLLAFPLFVVVVAVDSRWLAHALTTRFPALAGTFGSKGNDDKAQPDDYLEKIFQIPFWIRPMGDASRARLVRGLLAGHLRREDGATIGAGNGAEIPETAAQALQHALEVAPNTPAVDISDLTLDGAELESLASLGPLMGATPRSIKRLTNMYQLLKVLRRPRRDVAVSPGEEQLIGFVLALADGLPELRQALFDRAARAQPGETLAAVLQAEKDTTFEDCVTQLERLDQWLNAAPDVWKQVELSRIDDVARDVSQFLFRVGDGGNGADAENRLIVHLIRDR